MPPLAIDAVNAMSPAEFVAAFGGVFEHSPWVAERAARARPFANLGALHAAMIDAVEHAAPDERLALLNAHPELAGREAQAGMLTRDSTTEQGRLGFNALTPDELERVSRANRAYRARFGFPLIVALALHATRASVIAEMERRAAGTDREAEIATALSQVAAITRTRLAKLFD
jgi:OHCU decarboxylase